MKIFTFLGPVAGKSRSEEFALVQLWQTSWSARGWEPVVLTPSDLPTDRATRKLLRHFAALPSRNKRRLDMWCYARWLAVAHMGGGFMCDYDVINYEFSPRESSELTCYAWIVPCLVGGSAADFRRAVGWFELLEPDPWWRLWNRGSHVSDMFVLRDRQAEFKKLIDCPGYGETGWETAPAVHYSNYNMQPRGYTPRHEWIPKLRTPTWQ